MNGLHSCKPGNEPQIGQVKTFLIEQRTSASGKDWTKIKNAMPDQGGSPYKIMSVKPTGFEDAHGNISFNLDIEPAQNGAPTSGIASAARQNSDSMIDRSNRIERQHSQEMAIRYAALKGKTDVSTDDLRKLIDWFQRDVGRSPVKEQAEPQVEDDGPPPDEEESF